MKGRNAEKSQRQHLRLVLYLIAVMVFAILIEILILNSLNKKNANNTSLVLLNQVVGVIEENEANEEELIQTLKEDYIIRAQTVSYILQARPEAESDVEELQKIADLMRIDEIHIFDETGKIYSGTEPKYYGYSFDSGEQMAYFKPMLEDRALTMCQDVTPNTAEGKSMMYAIVWNEDGTKMIQVGIEPLRLLEELKSNEISGVIEDMPTYDGIDIWVADAATGVICGSTNEALLEKTLEEIGITYRQDEDGKASAAEVKLDGKKFYCQFAESCDYIVVAGYSAAAIRKTFLLFAAIEFLYLLLAGFTIVTMFRKALQAKEEKDAQVSVLVSMSDIYNSLHVIEIESDTFKEYNAREMLKKVTKNTGSASAALHQLMVMTTEEEYLEKALAFTDLSTLQDRMKGKKIIQQELVSKNIGWYVASFITIETSEDGRPVKVALVTRCIDKEKKKEEELIFESHADPLTGLYNRRAYEDDVAAYEEALENGDDSLEENNFAIVSLDVNGLKTVNDTLGHAAGDELLTGAAGCMKQCFGECGQIYRVGGDEFVAILFAAEEKLRRLLESFETAAAAWSGEQLESLAVSYGYVTAREGLTSIREMAELADQRMYEQKSRYYEEHPDVKRRIR